VDAEHPAGEAATAQRFRGQQRVDYRLARGDERERRVFRRCLWNRVGLRVNVEPNTGLTSPVRRAGAVVRPVRLSMDASSTARCSTVAANGTT
jgi:hypothetical protein